MTEYALFILSHGRPDRITTYDLVRRNGYTGKIYIVIDDEDPTEEEYREIYGDQVIQFSKIEAAKITDACDNFPDRRAVVYARNKIFDLVEDLGLTYFIVMDDDYKSFRYRVDSDLKWIPGEDQILSLDHFFENMFDYLKSAPRITCLAVAQSGDFIGGEGNDMLVSIFRRRKCMNVYFCSTERRFPFIGKINEDVSVYTHYQSMGNLFITFPLVTINQIRTQANKGGLTDIYLDYGTYVKSFYTVLYSPSSVAVELMHSANARLHHKIYWRYTIPYLLSEKYKK